MQTIQQVFTEADLLIKLSKRVSKVLLKYVLLRSVPKFVQLSKWRRERDFPSQSQIRKDRQRRRRRHKRRAAIFFFCRVTTTTILRSRSFPIRTCFYDHSMCMLSSIGLKNIREVEGLTWDNVNFQLTIQRYFSRKPCSILSSSPFPQLRVFFGSMLRVWCQMRDVISFSISKGKKYMYPKTPLKCLCYIIFLPAKSFFPTRTSYILQRISTCLLNYCIFSKKSHFASQF